MKTHTHSHQVKNRFKKKRDDTKATSTTNKQTNKRKKKTPREKKRHNSLKRKFPHSLTITNVYISFYAHFPFKCLDFFHQIRRKCLITVIVRSLSSRWLNFGRTTSSHLSQYISLNPPSNWAYFQHKSSLSLFVFFLNSFLRYYLHILTLS